MNPLTNLRLWWHKPIMDELEQLRAIEPALGRIIAKLDPRFSTSETDVDRKADSDALGRIVIAKLLAEDKARRHTTGDL